MLPGHCGPHRSWRSPILPHEAESSLAEDNAWKLTLSNPVHHTEPNQQPLSDVVGFTLPTYPSAMVRKSSAASSDAEDSSGSGSGTEETLKHVINVKNFPLCHCARLNKKADMGIITHLAVCASSDWARSIGS